MAKVTLKVPNINCNHCVHTIKTELSEVAGVKTVEPSFQTKQVVVTFDAPATEQTIRETLTQINYPAAA